MSMAVAEVTLSKGPTFVWGAGKKTKQIVMAESLRALASMLELGASEAMSLAAVGEEYHKFTVGRAYERASKRMSDEGATLVQSLEMEDDVFPRTVMELLDAAPNASSVYLALERAAKLVASAQDIKKKLTTSMIQPGFMLGMATVFLFVASAVIIPGIIKSFSTLSQTPPESAVIILKIAKVVEYVIGGLIVLIIISVIFWFVYGKNSSRWRVLMDTVAMRAPLIGPIVRLAAASRLMELLAANLSTGKGEPDALISAGAGAGNEALSRHCEVYAEQMREEGIVTLGGFADTKLMPDNAKHMLRINPSIRQQITIMERLGPKYRLEADQQLDSFQKTIEPIMTYVAYGVAGLLIVAVIVPMYSIFPALMKLSGTS